MLFDHVTIRVSDRAAVEPVYARLLGVLGFDLLPSVPGFARWGDFLLAQADADRPATRGLHIGFRAPSRKVVDEFWRAGLDAGLRDDGEPGPRPEYREDYYGGFLLDPDGNSIEAVHHGAMPRRGCVDHVWLRVANVERSNAFYELVGRFAGFAPTEREPGLFHYHGGGPGSFSTVAGTATLHAHMAFPAPDRAAVDAFHAAALATGHRDDGLPGERPEYHPGYYGTFVLDPDGNNIELVRHA